MREAQQKGAHAPSGTSVKFIPASEREQLTEAKRLLREALPVAAERLARILKSPRTKPEVLERVFRLAADRCGLPPMTQIEATVAAAPPILLKIEGGLGWPAPLSPEKSDAAGTPAGAPDDAQPVAH